MTDNLIFLLNKLSYHIVADAVNSDKVYNAKQKGEKCFRQCVRKITQKGCDVLLGKTSVLSLPDPCITDYGGNWSPITLLTDYAREYEYKGASKYHSVLMNSIKCLQEGDYDCVNELLKFLLIIKGPFFETQMQNDSLSICQSEFLLSPMDSMVFLLDEPLPSINNCLTRQSSFKRALKYEESWTKSFDSKFQVLGEYSKKNLLVPEKVSFDSLFSAKPTIASQSQSNSFVFTDFCLDKNYQSEKNLFDLSRSSNLSDVPLLDSFVDNPISHKLPSMLNSSKGISKSSYFMRSCDQTKRKLDLLKEEDQVGIGLCLQDSVHNEFSECKLSSERSAIELKRNSNCSHSFAILYEKSMNNKSDEPSLSSNDNLLTSRDRRKSKFERNSLSKESYSSGKEIVLGLWEHDKSILKEFRPELASSMPVLRMITLVEFVEDVKYLLTGINSGTFKFNSKDFCYYIEFGTCLSDVTPESLFHFSKEFLEIGNYYMKLSACATENGKSNFETCTSVSQAFWKGIFDYLELHYSMVLEIPVTVNLMMLKASVKDIHEMIMTVSNICKVVQEDALPKGGQLLTYLIHMVQKVNLPSAKNIVFGILQNCCFIYFKCILQPWLFRGLLEKENNEFFIDCSKQKMNVKSRNYYCSFFIANEKIPSFLRGLEENIFNCGKSIHFLKLFNLEDKFCQFLEKLNFPDMNLCLSDDALENLEIKFKDYENRAIEICGKNISIVNLRNEELEKEKRFIEYVKECKIKQEEERRLAKLLEMDELKAKKEMQNKLLNDELKRMLEEKEKKKSEEKEALRVIEDKINQAAENEKAIINQEKNFIINYFDGVMKNLETQLDVIKMRKKDLQQLLSDSPMDQTTKDYPELTILNENKSDGYLIETNRIGSETSCETQSIDLNSNPIKSAPLSLSSIPTIMLSCTTNENILSMDENSNVRSDFNDDQESERSVLVNEWKQESDDQNCKINENEAWKSLSQGAVAATDAMKNKIKVLKSEFGIEFKEYCTAEEPIQKGNKNLALKKSDKVLKDSEYNLLKCGSDLILIKPVTSQTQIVKESLVSSIGEFITETDIKSAESVCLKDAMNFCEIGLKRKRECFNLDNPLGEKSSEGSDAKTSNSDSLSSFITPPTFDISEENVSNGETNQEPKESTLKEGETQEIDSSSGLLLINPQYQNSLERDAEISNHKLSYDDIFQNPVSVEFDNLPCTEVTKFQRFMRKSVQIPLLIQEKLANDALLKHLLIEENLLSHLKSLRGFFFLNDGEFGRCFTHNTFRSLAKCRESHEFFERSNLSNIVNEALNYTIHSSENNSQNLSFKIVKMPPFLNHSSHDVLSPFELSYKVKWPLNLILTDKALSKYKYVFKFLLKLKRIVWTLNENCLYLNSLFKSGIFNKTELASSPHYHKIQIYRHAMTQVIITLDDYLFSNGIQLPWINFLQDLEATANIDHLYQKHVRYLKDVLLRCFLSKNSKDLLSCIHNIIELALKFHYTTVSCPLISVEGRYEHPKFTVLKATFNEFCAIIKTFLRTLKEKIATNQVINSYYLLIEMFDMKLT